MDPVPIVLQENDAVPETWNDPTRGSLAFRTLFGGRGSRTRHLTGGVAELEPDGWLGMHSHAPAEIYYLIQGVALLQLDDAEHLLGTGSAVFIPGGTEHGLTNVGTTPVRLFYMLAAESFDQVEYTFAG
jgi:quercetin dioxygenase-like cupin family protein